MFERDILSSELEILKSIENEYSLAQKLSKVIDWKNLLLFKVPDSIVTELKSRKMKIQYAHDESYSNDLNTDFYRLTIKKFPSLNGVQFTPETLIQYIRLRINDFLDTSISSFAPYSPADMNTWISDKPLGSVLYIRTKKVLGIRDNAAVAVTHYNPLGWRFSTVNTPLSGRHPVSGHREFFIGRETFKDKQRDKKVKKGYYHFVIKGLDMSSSGVAGAGFPVGANKGFGIADNLWKSMLDKIMAFINSNGGIAQKTNLYSERVEWRYVYYRFGFALSEVFGKGAGSAEKSPFFKF